MTLTIRTKMMLWYTLVLAVGLTVFAAVSYFALERALGRATDDALLSAAGAFATSIEAEFQESTTGLTDEGLGAEAAIEEAVGEFRSTEHGFAVYDPAGRLVATTALGGSGPSEAAPPQALGSLLVESRRDGAAFATFAGEVGDRRAAGVTLQVGGRPFTLVCTRDLRAHLATLALVRRSLAFAAPLVLAFAALGGVFLMRRALAPIAAMGTMAESITARNLHERLPVANPTDEAGRLARIINDLLARLEGSFTQQRRFMADASHELRTPVSVIRGEAEVAISQPDRPAADYRESLGIVYDEARRLARIVDDLFLLARADAGQVPLRYSRFYLDETVSEVARALRTLAASRGVRITVETPGEVSYRGDEELIRGLAMNLLENALRYTPEGECVRVRLRRDEGSCTLEVENPGPSIPAEAQLRVFDRFYRFDSSRTRLGGGAGLGLSISRWIAEAHGGRLSLGRSDDHGTVFAATLPSS